jgi:hypothetical protein
MFFENLVKSSYELKKLKPRNIINTRKREIVSTRTVVLNNLTESNKRFVNDLADQMRFNKSLRTETWHLIFDFFSNEDYPPRKIIYVDLETFVKKSGIDTDMGLI